MGNHKKSSDLGTEAILQHFLPKKGESIPLSLIIPVYNCSEAIGLTFESIQKQEYEPIEIIVIDAGSTDRTLEVVNSFGSFISRVYSVTKFNLSDMINRGISLATKEYISFLFPGSFYLFQDVYRIFAQTIIENQKPDLVYCGSLQREIASEPRIVLEPFDAKLLEQGKHPATLPACWFRADLFEKFEKFNTSIAIRAGFDFFCRLALDQKIKIILIDRVCVDFDYGRFSYGKVLRYAAETWRTLTHHFGVRKAFVWFLSINHLTILKWLWYRLKARIFKK